MALFKAELIVFGKGQQLSLNGETSLTTEGTLAWKVNEHGSDSCFFDGKFGQYLGVCSTPVTWVIAKHNTVRKSNIPIRGYKVPDLGTVDYLDYVLPRWSWLRGYAHPEKFADIHSTGHGDCVFVGRVATSEMVAVLERMRPGSIMFIVGRTHTMTQWAEGTTAHSRAKLYGVNIICVVAKVGEWFRSLLKVPQFRLENITLCGFGLNVYKPSIIGSVSEFATRAKMGTAILAVGPAEGNTSDLTEDVAIYSTPFSMGSLSTVDLEWPTRSKYNTYVVTTNLDASFVPLPAPVGPAPFKFMGLDMTQFVEQDFTDYAAGRDPTTDAEWAAAGAKMLAKHPDVWGNSPVTFKNGFTLAPMGPNWATRHRMNWTRWIAQAESTGLTMTNALVIGVFEGMSVQLWNDITDSKLANIYCIDPGRTLSGPWGFPRVAHMHGNLPPNAVPLIGQSGTVLPLLVNRLAYSDEKVQIIEIDGSHHADDVLADSEYAWRILEVGGIMVHDDYSNWSGKKFDPIDTTNVYSASRGIHAFMWQHRGEYRVLDNVDAEMQICFQKVRNSPGYLVGTADVPYDMDAVWNAANTAGETTRVGKLGRPHLPELRGTDDDAWFDADTNEDMALGAIVNVAKMVPQSAAGTLHMGAHVAKNIGGGFEQIGETIGSNQKDNAVAGFGNMFKSFGNGALKTSQFLGWGAKKTAEIWVPKEARWW